MEFILMNFVLIFAIVSYELPTVWSGNNTLEYTWNRKNVTQALKDMNLFQLIDFQEPILIAQDVFDDDNGTLVCEHFEKIQDIEPKIYKGVGEMQCHGWIDSCQSIRDDIRRKNPAVYCYSDHYKRLTWVRDRNSNKYGYNTGRCRKMKLQPDKTTMPKNNYVKNACLCKCTGGSNNPELNTTNWAFSLQPQISDIDNNKIVSGIRIATHGKIIYLEIRESQIGSSENDSWKVADSQNELIRDEDYSFLEPDSRSMNLDKIFVPADYVVTGVKFTKIPTNHANGQNWTLRIEVQGTKLDLVTKKLINGTSVWFNSDTSAEFSTQHGQKRSRIFLKRSSPLSPMNNDNRIYKPNTSIRFTTTNLKTDLGKFTIPYLSTSPVQSETNKFLNGIGLLYKGKQGYVGYIVPEIYTTELNIDKNESVEELLTKRNKEESSKNEVMKDINIPSKCQTKSRDSNHVKVIKRTVKKTTVEIITEEIIGEDYMIDENRLPSITDEYNDAIGEEYSA